MSIVSQGSIQADGDGQNDSIDNISAAISNTDAILVDDSNNARARRRKQWKLFRRRNIDNATRVENETSRGMLLVCRCKGGVNAACLITCLSIIELVGNILGLVFGIAYIQSACKFYTLKQEYDENLERVLFLEKYRVGFIGLLATCLVGLTVAFLMPFGTIYKSWKSLRAAMSLLFSICLAHILLASFYLRDNELSATLAAVPFRVLEILLMWSHISAYKRKKRQDKLKAAEKENESSQLGQLRAMSKHMRDMDQKNFKGKQDKSRDKERNLRGQENTENMEDDGLNEGKKRLQEHLDKKRNNMLPAQTGQTWDDELQRQMQQASMFVQTDIPIGGAPM